VATLAATLAVAGITALAAPASATADALGVPITGFRAEVGPGTPAFNVDLVFTIGSGLNCTTTTNHDAELRWKVTKTPEAEIPAPPGSNGNGFNLAGVKKVCRAGSSGAYSGTLTEIKVTLPMWSPAGSFAPDQMANVMAELEPAGVDDRISPAKPSLTVEEKVGRFRAPARPVWISVGDGYTSAAYQESDCALTLTADACADFSSGGGLTSLDQPAVSWTTYAITGLVEGVDLDGDGVPELPGLHIPAEWEIDYIPLATIAASGASLQAADSESQIQKIKDALAGVAPTAERPASWNWLGLTAGLQDSGIVAALNSWYTAHPPDLNDPTVNNPWALDTATCPDYASVRTNLESDAVKLPLQDGLLDVIDTALDGDPNVRIVHPQYPYFVDEASPCRPAVVDAVDALNGVASKAALQARLADRPEITLSGAQFDRVFDLSMHAAFNDPHPTGVTVGEASAIQLTKPWGYPHPSAEGAQRMGNAIAQFIGAEADAQPPTVQPILEPADASAAPIPGSDWFRGPVRIKLRVTDPASAAGPTYVTLPVITADGQHAGLRTPAPGSPGQICSAVSGLCADDVGIPEIKIDSTPPRVAATDQLTGAALAPGTWFNRDVTVLWKMTDDNASGANVVSGTDSTTDNVSTTIAATSLVLPPAGKLCDRAGNCSSPPASVNIEKAAPTIAAPVLTPAAGGTSVTVAGTRWYRSSSVTVSWPSKPDDTGGSGLVTAFDVKPADQSVSIDGLNSLTPFPTSSAGFCDNAGNCTLGAVQVRIDHTAPTVKLFGGPSLDSQVEVVNGASLPDLNVFTCAAADETSGLATTPANPAGCTATLVSSSPVSDGLSLTYNVTATDVVGNAATASFTFIGEGLTDVVAPVITLAGPQAGARYPRFLVPTATCSGTDPTPGSGYQSCSVAVVSSVPLPAYGPPGSTVTIRATGKDNVGNTGVSAPVTYTVFDITPKTTGKFNGNGSLIGRPAGSEFSLQCDGRRSNLKVAWLIGSFDLTAIDQMYCWDDARFSEPRSNAPVDSIWLIGKGKLGNGKIGTIEVTLTDQGEPGRDRDTLSFLIKDNNGVVVLASAGKLAGGGNVQAG
jgi:hypothetical protein